MCESTATVYLKEGKQEKVLMKDVAAVRSQGGKLLLTSILGERLELEAVVSELDFMGHRIVVEGPSGSPRDR
jgi:predicted RNA-binding protein